MSLSSQSYKELAIPYFKEAFDSIDEIMLEMRLPYYLIGVSAISLELLKNGIKPNRGTKDIDFAVMISSKTEYDEISTRLEAKGFHKVEAPYTFYSDKYKVAIDLLPFGEVEENYTDNFTERHTDLHLLGFREVMEEAKPVQIEQRIAQIPPLPGMVILKLIAWSDRPEERENDLSDILIIIQHYYDLAWDDIVASHYDTLNQDPFDPLIIAAEVLGRDSSIYLQKSEAISERVLQVLNANLKDASKSLIAKDWARKLDKNVDYAFNLLKAFEKGLSENITKQE